AGARVLDDVLGAGMQQQRVSLLDRQGLTVAARNALAVQDMKELMRGGMLVGRRRAARPEYLNDEDVSDPVRHLIEQDGKIIGVLRRNAESFRVREFGNAE